MDKKGTDSKVTSAPSPWLSIVRYPNLFTAGGDPLAGYLLATAGTTALTLDNIIGPKHLLTMGIAALTSILIYAGGMIHNDICGLEEDRTRNPLRPLVTGTISLAAAKRATALLLLAGFFMGSYIAWTPHRNYSTIAVVLTLVLCVMFYNKISSERPIAGYITMGLCRGLNFLFGASLVIHNQWITGTVNPNRPAVMVMALLWISYTAVITCIASGEHEKSSLRFARYLPVLIMPLWFAGMALSQTNAMTTPGQAVCPLVCWFLAFAGTITTIGGLREGAESERVKHSVVLLIRNIILLQASVCFLTRTGYIPGVILVICYCVHPLLCRKYCAT